MSIPSTNKKDSHHALPGSSISLIAVTKTDALMASKLKEISRDIEKDTTQVYVIRCKKPVNTAIQI